MPMPQPMAYLLLAKPLRVSQKREGIKMDLQQSKANLQSQLKSFADKVGIQNFIIGVLVIGMLIMIYLVWWNPKTVDAQALITKMGKQITEQYQKELQSRDDKIKMLSMRIEASEKKFTLLNKTLLELKNENIKILPPKTNAELRKRFTDRGYTPMP
jgi:cell division protein FtsL